MLPPRPHLFGFLVLLAPTLTLAAVTVTAVKGRTVISLNLMGEAAGQKADALVELARLVALKV